MSPYAQGRHWSVAGLHHWYTHTSKSVLTRITCNWLPHAWNWFWNWFYKCFYVESVQNVIHQCVAYVVLSCYLLRGWTLLQSALPKGQLCRYCFYSRADFSVFHPARRYVAPIKVKYGLLLIGSVVWVYGPKTLKIWDFTNIIASKGRIPCMILTKFTGFMWALDLHNFTKFGWFISINDKIINNLSWWGHLQPNFWWPLAAKLLIGSKNVWGCNDSKVWWKSNDAHRHESTKCDVFSLFYGQDV